jgi:uncharacterized membrane protein
MTQLMTFSTKINPALVAKTAISLVYGVGIIGLLWEESRSLFQQLTPFHLLLNAMILFYFHQDWNSRFVIFALLAFMVGMVSEIIGVKTGLIFGEYSYGPVLGWKIMEVPVIIGINWLLLAYMWGKLAATKKWHPLVAAILASIGMVIMDFIIEPVAIKLDFWSWMQPEIPLSNYVGWLAIALLIQLSFQLLQFSKKNTISNYLLLNMCIFFAILNVLL